MYNLLELPLDVKITIASQDQRAWITLAIYDDEVNKYTRDHPQHFIDTFARPVLTDHRSCSYTEWVLFGILFRGYKPARVYENGTEMWFKNGKRHNSNDKPAEVGNNVQRWYYYGTLHRDTRDENNNLLPAVIYSCDQREWYNYGRLHNDNDNPATISSVCKVWYDNGRRHRINDKPAVIHSNGNMEWRINDKLHREVNELGETLPAIITPEYSKWYYNGKLHRDGDQPAEIYSNGAKRWYCYDQLHRTTKDENGQFMPAVIKQNGTCEQWINGFRFA